MKEDIKAWTKIIWKIIRPFWRLFIFPITLVTFLNCVVVHQKYWEYSYSLSFWQQGFFGVAHQYRDDIFECRKCHLLHVNGSYEIGISFDFEHHSRGKTRCIRSNY